MTTNGGLEPQDRLPHVPAGDDASMPVIGPGGVIEPARTPTSGEVVRHARSSPAPALPPESSLTAVLGDCRREGAWRVGRATTVYSILGDVLLDLRQAVLDAEIIEMRAYTVMGDLKVIVPPGVEVRLRGFSVLGDQKHRDKSETGESGRTVPTRHTLVVNGTGVMGDVSVVTLDLGQREPKWWRRRKG